MQSGGKLSYRSAKACLDPFGDKNDVAYYLWPIAGVSADCNPGVSADCNLQDGGIMRGIAVVSLWSLQDWKVLADCSCNLLSQHARAPEEVPGSAIGNRRW